MAKRRVLIVGGGIAGLAFATAAGRRGFDLDLVEIDPRVVGFGIFLTGSTLRALDSIGLAHECVGEGWAADSLRLFDGAGTCIGNSPLPRVASSDLPVSAGIPRRKLARILGGAAERAGARIRFGLTIDRIEQDPDGVDVVFSDGTAGRYDVVVGADGIYSRVRDLVFGQQIQPEVAGQGGWRFMTPRHPDADGVRLYTIGGFKAGFIPLDEDWMYLLCTVPDPHREWIEPAAAPSRFRDLMQRFTAPLISEICARLDTADPAMVLWRPFETLLLEDGWSRGRVVLVGDAVHSMTPHLSSGGGMAIEDAVVLASFLDTDVPVDQALQSFFQQRIARVRKIQGISTEICKEEISANPSIDRIYQLTVEGYGALADTFDDGVSAGGALTH